MSQWITHRLDHWLRISSPMAFTFLLAILSVVPIGVPGYPAVVPAFTSMAVFYWAVFRPDLQPASAVFLVGVLQDSLGAMPIGISAITLLVVHGLALSQRRAFLGKPFYLAWLGYMIILSISSVLVWAVWSSVELSVINPMPLIFQILLSVGLFPIVAWVFVRLHRHVVR